jgi:hypothetical protein
MDRRSLIKTPASPACWPPASRPPCTRRPPCAGASPPASPSRSTPSSAAPKCSRRPSRPVGRQVRSLGPHAAGELMPAFGVVDGVQGGTSKWRTPRLLLLRQGPDLRARLRHALRPDSRQMTAWMDEGNGRKLMREFYAKYNIIKLQRRQHRHADGRLVPQGDQVVADFKGLKMRIGGFGGKVMAKHGRACRRTSPAARSTRRWKRARIDAAEFVGPYDDEKLGFNKVAPFYYYPGWWEGGPSWSSSSTPRPTRAVGREQGHRRCRHQGRRARHDAKYDA